MVRAQSTQRDKNTRKEPALAEYEDRILIVPSMDLRQIEREAAHGAQRIGQHGISQSAASGSWSAGE